MIRLSCNAPLLAIIDEFVRPHRIADEVFGVDHITAAVAVLYRSCSLYQTHVPQLLIDKFVCFIIIRSAEYNRCYQLPQSQWVEIKVFFFLWAWKKLYEVKNDQEG